MQNLLQLNVVAPALLASAAVKAMVREGRGSVINIASVLALLPEYSQGIYAATKSYVLTLSQSLATELNAKDIYMVAPYIAQWMDTLRFIIRSG
ncbi:SDR family NAD(P)-dependent oxidoreductase [Pectobacterium brasiliense]|nr:SDR family NAD(P)-dependent oxidoreductase [Pectobacterium brasiliense]WGL26024.1 SDR family NAD(P)-dependent oxidoreductase [Pectobacterium brasiliense]